MHKILTQIKEYPVRLLIAPLLLVTALGGLVLCLRPLWAAPDDLEQSMVLLNSVLPVAWSVSSYGQLMVVVVLCLALGTMTASYTIWSFWRQNRTLLQTLHGISHQLGALLEKAPREENGLLSRLDWLVGSLAETLQQIHARLEERNGYLQMLYEVTEQFNQQLSTNGVVRIVIEAVWRMPRIHFVAVVLGEGEMGPFQYVGVRGVKDPFSVLEQECPVPLWGVLAQALVHHPGSDEPDYLVIDDIAAEGRPVRDELVWESESGSLMIIPLRYSGKTMGAMLIGSETPHQLSDPVLDQYLFALSGNMARALRETQNRQQSNRWIRQLVSLQALTRTITKAQDLDAIFKAVCTELEEMFGDATVQIFLKRCSEEKATTGRYICRGMAPIQDSEALQANFHALHSAHAPDVAEQRWLGSDSIQRLVRWVMEAEQPLFFDASDLSLDPSELYYRVHGQSLLVPIGEEKPLGVILMWAPERSIPFDESDMVIMRTIANSAAIAIGNVRLYQRLHKTQPHSAMAAGYSGVT